MLVIDGDNNKKNKREIHFHRNPLVELVASLHVLSNPDHHEHCQSWVMKMNSVLDKSLRSEINYFATNYTQWLFIMDIVTDIACEMNGADEQKAQNFEYCLNQFEQLDNEEFAYVFLGMGAFKFSREELHSWQADPESISAEQLENIGFYISINNVKMFLNNVDSYKSRLINIFRSYWKKAFSDFWVDQIAKYLEEAVLEQKALASRKSTIEYILGVHDLIVIEDGKLIIRKEVNYEMELSEIVDIHVFPSMFTGPHLMMDIRDSRLILYYNLDFHALDILEPVPPELLEMLKVLGDESRLKILRLIWEEQLTTQRLAQILNLAPSTVSVHLKLLKKSDLVKCVQSKKFVYYSANEERIEDVWPQLMDYLR